MIRRVALRLMHIVDDTAVEDGVRLLALLLTRMPASEVEQEVVVIGAPPANLTLPEQIPVHRIGRRFGGGLTYGVDLQRLVAQRSPDVVHAWSMSAAALASISCEAGRLAVTLSDPAEARDSSRWWRSGEGVGATVTVCATKVVQRKVVEAGILPQSTLVIRSGVDFAALKAAKGSVRRADLGLPPDGRILLTPSPPSREGGHFLAAWAMAILHQLWPDARLVIPGCSREQQRLQRLRDEVYCPEVFLLMGDRYTPAELLAVADALVVPAMDEVPTGWLAWGMAASVPIIAAAVPSVAELIADRQNGFLYHPNDVHSLAVRVRTVFDTPDVIRQCTETARGQAYDVFRTQACVDQYLRLYQNLRAGRIPGEGVVDTAMDV